MATGAPSTDREFLFRIQTLIIDGGTDVLRNIFDQKVQLQNMPLNVFLANEKTSINRLRGQKTITATQYHQLFPPSGQHPTSADFDITLIICLLRNLPSLGLNPKYSWNVPPQPADTSVESDLCRLKGFRNEIAHISSTVGFQQTIFQTKWTEIEKVLLRLNGAVLTPIINLKQVIDSYKNTPLDPVAEKQNQTYIEQWREMEKGLDTEMQLIKKDIKEVNQDVKDVKGVIKEVTEVKGVLKEMKEHVELLAKDTEEDRTKVTIKVKEVNENVAEMKLDVDNVKGNVIDVKEDVREVKRNVKTVKDVTENIKTVKEDVGKVKGCVTEVRGDIQEVKVDVREVKDHFEKVEKLLKEQKEATEASILKGASGAKIRKKPSKLRRFFKTVLSFGRKKGRTPTPVTEPVTETVTKPVTETVTEPATEPITEPITKADEDYIRMKTQLKGELIQFYKRQHATIPLSPIVEEEEDTPLLDFYVMPDINSVKLQRAFGGGKEEKTTVQRFSDIFFTENDFKVKTFYNEIYVTADAGFGKTSFSKRLALTWCHAKKPISKENRYFKQDEIDAMAEFDFVFLLLLRDSSNECDIDDLILNQIASQLAHSSYTLTDLENILSKERCLIILDGLDEWTHPSNSCRQGWSSIPHRKARDCSVLTTTRPWKLSVSGVKLSQINQKLEIAGLSMQSANVLKTSVISHICNEKDEDKLKEYVSDFTTAVKEREMSDLVAVPLLLMYMICLWCQKIDLGQTHGELYCNIIEFLLSRTVEKCSDIQLVADKTQRDTPQCFSKLSHCRKFCELLTALGQLAFKTLFGETKEENTLVFDSSVAEQYLNKESLTFCFRTGIISQSKIPGNLTKRELKVSFAHKTLQEFFAALYMSYSPDQNSVIDTVLSKCKCVEDILESSNIFTFLSSINMNLLSAVSRELMEIVNGDEITQEYRSRLEDGEIPFHFNHPLYEFQNICNSWCKELPIDDEISFCLQDVFIDGNCQQTSYSENLKQLTTKNKQNIRSVYICMDKTPYGSAHEVVENFELNELVNIEKVQYWGRYTDQGILPLLNRSVRNLCVKIHQHMCSDRDFWTPLLSEKVTRLQNLEAIYISGFYISHSQLKDLFQCISQRNCMREIVLSGLYCTDHKLYPCTGFSLDMSHHSRISKLALCRVPLTELHMNMLSLEECCLDLSCPDLILHFLNCDSADSKLNIFQCMRLNSSTAIDAMLDTLLLSVNVKHVRLSEMNLGNRQLHLSSEMMNMERVDLWEMTLSASAIQELVNIVEKLPKTVTVFMVYYSKCNITPEREFQTVKSNINLSQHFRVTKDSDDWFQFNTIKDRN